MDPGPLHEFVEAGLEAGHVEQEPEAIEEPPGAAGGVVRVRRSGLGGIPALDHLQQAPPRGGGVVPLDVVPADELALGRRRVLEVLGREMRRPHLQPLAVQRLARLAGRAEHIADLAGVDLATPTGDRLGALGDRRQVEMGVDPHLHEASWQVVLVQALGDDDDPPGLRVVKPREEASLVELVGQVARSRRGGIGCLHEIIDDDVVGPKAGDRPSDRGRPAIASGLGHQVALGVAAWCSKGWKRRLVPGRGHHLLELPGQLRGEIAAVAGDQELQARIASHRPGHEGHRDGDGLQVPRRDGDDEPSLLAPSDLIELMAHGVDVPVPYELRRRVEGEEDLPQEEGKVLVQRQVQGDAGAGDGDHDSSSGSSSLRRRSKSASMAISWAVSGACAAAAGSSDLAAGSSLMRMAKAR